MSITRVNKNGSISISGLSPDEYYIIRECVNKCKESMKWDDDVGKAIDTDSQIWTMDRVEFLTLQLIDI